MGAACLVVLGHMVACFAQDFAPVPQLTEAYLSLLATLHPFALHEHRRVAPGDLLTGDTDE